MRHNIKLVISYDGTDLWGWQETAAGPSVEALLRMALERVLQEKITLQAASRTDRGVHAEGQVVNFFTSKELNEKSFKRGVNSLLPEAIRVLQVEKMELSFHPTLDALEKEYRYTFTTDKIPSPMSRHFAWHIPYPLDREAMERAARLFLGTHDFSALCNARKDGEKVAKKCTITAIILSGDTITVRGEKFLYKMVRNLVGTLIGVGRGKIAAEEIPSLLQAKKRALAGVTAPAHGLKLINVRYL